MYGLVTNVERPIHHRFTRSAENNGIVSESVAEDPNVSIPRPSQEVGLSYGTLWRILHVNLHLRLYKVQLTQQLKPADHSQCRRYLEWVLEQQAMEGKFLNKIFFSDESHFTFGGYVNNRRGLVCSVSAY